MKNNGLEKTFFKGLLLLLLLVVVPAFDAVAAGTSLNVAQDGKVVAWGVVTDKATNEPIVGANVTVWVGEKLLAGTSTGVEGEFRIISPVSDFELQVSFIGYKEFSIHSNGNDLENLRIELFEDSNLLSDIVVTGFVAKNRETFTGSVTEMSGLELKQVSGTNLITAISALTPGMAMVQNTSQGSNPNHTPELVLRA